MEELNDNLKSKDTLKTFFQQGDIPEEAQFADLIDAFRHINDGYTIKEVSTAPNGITSITLSNGAIVAITPPVTDEYVPKTGGTFTGKVGIGTSILSGLLTLNGNDTNLLRLENDTPGKEANMRFRSKSNSGGKLHSDISLHATGENQGYLGFKVPHNNTVNAGYNMVINHEGEVGIGTKNPAQKLHVNGGHIRIQSSYGYADIGSRNADWFHFETNRPNFWFNKGVFANGNLGVYQKDTFMNFSTGNIHENGALLSDKYLSKTAKALDSDKLDGKDSSAFLQKTGGTMTGDLIMTNRVVRWSENTDTALIGFKNDGDADNNSYMYFKTSDNDNEHFKWLHKTSGNSSDSEWMSLKANGLNVQGNIYEGGTALSNKYLGKTEKAIDSEKVDGINGASLLRSDLDDTFTGKLSVGSSSKRQAGIYGIYDSTKIGHIWSMGKDYKITQSGSSFGNLYGLAYKHTNNTTGGTMAGGHQAVWCHNGVPKVALGSNIWTSGTIYEGGTALSSKYLGKTAKAADSEKVDGINGASLLRSDADDTFTGKLSVGSTSKRQAGIYGVYDSTKIGHIWSMGTDYKITQSGSSFGNLYGFAYKHTNNPTGGTMAGEHQAVWCNNGVPKVALGTHIWTSGNIYANGSGYYGDGKRIIRFDDGWLRLNPDSAFNAGIYCGTKIFRTDGQLEVGANGDKFKVTASGTVTSAGNIYEGGTALSSKYLGKTAKAADSDKLDGIDSSGFVRNGIDAHRSWNNEYLIFTHNGADNVDAISYNDTDNAFHFNADRSKTNTSSNAKVYAGTLYEGTTALSNKYLGKTAKAADSNKLGGLTRTGFLEKTGGTINGNLTVNGSIYADEQGLKSGDGKGYRFWNSNSYKIYMSDVNDGTWGGRVNGETSSDYNMYFKMTGGSNRGFVYRSGSNNVAGIDASGNGRFEGSLYAYGNVTAYSDKRLKKALQPIKESVLDKIDKLKPTFYQWKDKAKDQAKQLGFIAQDVKEVFPEWVHKNGEHYSMSYDKMGAVLAVQGIQELHAEIKALKEELKSLRDEFTK